MLNGWLQSLFCGLLMMHLEKGTGQIKKEKNNWGNQNVQMSFQPRAVLYCFVF